MHTTYEMHVSSDAIIFKTFFLKVDQYLAADALIVGSSLKVEVCHPHSPASLFVSLISQFNRDLGKMMFAPSGWRSSWPRSMQQRSDPKSHSAVCEFIVTCAIGFL